MANFYFWIGLETNRHNFLGLQILQKFDSGIIAFKASSVNSSGTDTWLTKCMKPYVATMPLVQKKFSLSSQSTNVRYLTVCFPLMSLMYFCGISHGWKWTTSPMKNANMFTKALDLTSPTILSYYISVILHQKSLDCLVSKEQDSGYITERCIMQHCYVKNEVFEHTSLFVCNVKCIIIQYLFHSYATYPVIHIIFWAFAQ